MSQLATIATMFFSLQLPEKPLQRISRMILSMSEPRVMSHGSRTTAAAVAAVALCAGISVSQLTLAQPAEAPLPDGGEVQTAAAAEPAPPSRLELQIERDRLAELEDFAAAAALANQLLDLIKAETGESSLDTAQATEELADLQRQAGDYDAAELSYLNAIEIYRTVDGPFSEQMIDPSIGLGDAYQSDDQYTNAIAAYNEARTLQRRNLGLLSEEQIAVMDRMTESFEAMAMYEDAEQQQLAARELIMRVHGNDSEEALEAIYRYARWLSSLSRFSEEREEYERAARMIRSQYGRDHPLLVVPYRAIAASFRRQGLEEPNGISRLNASLELLQAQPQRDRQLIAAVLTDLGDWKTAFDVAGSGQEDYLLAWDVLGEIPGGEALREQWFQSNLLRIVFQGQMSSRGLAPDANYPGAAEGFVLFRLDVDPFGRSTNIMVIESDPIGFKDESAARALGRSRFRPRIIDGQFVATTNKNYLWTFAYIPDRER